MWISSPSITKISGIHPSPLVTAYDNEDNHLLMKYLLHSM
jgi:hypothetical protein